MVSVKILKSVKNYVSKFVSYKTRPSQLVIYVRDTSRNEGYEISVDFIEMSDYEWKLLGEVV